MSFSDSISNLLIGRGIKPTIMLLGDSEHGKTGCSQLVSINRSGQVFIGLSKPLVLIEGLPYRGKGGISERDFKTFLNSKREKTLSTEVNKLLDLGFNVNGLETEETDIIKLLPESPLYFKEEDFSEKKEKEYSERLLKEISEFLESEKFPSFTSKAKKALENAEKIKKQSNLNDYNFELVKIWTEYLRIPKANTTWDNIINSEFERIQNEENRVPCILACCGTSHLPKAYYLHEEKEEVVEIDPGLTNRSRDILYLIKSETNKKLIAKNVDVIECALEKPNESLGSYIPEKGQGHFLRFEKVPTLSKILKEIDTEKIKKNEENLEVLKKKKGILHWFRKK